MEKTLLNPFSDKFIVTWQLWKDFRKEEHNFSYKGVISEQMAFKRLVTVSEGDEVKAIRIVEQSISRGWMDFYQLKQSNPKSGNDGNTTKSTTKGQSNGDSLEDRVANEYYNRIREREQGSDGNNLKAV